MWFRSLYGNEISDIKSFKEQFVSEYIGVEKTNDQEKYWNLIFQGPKDGKLINFLRKIKN